jgi:serine/threonine protein kinase
MKPMAEPVDPAEQFDQLWSTGQRPDLNKFAARQPMLTAEQLAALVRIDQRERSRLGEPILAEQYLTAFPQLIAETDLAVDVVYHEYLLREQKRESPTAAEYRARFPQYATLLMDQIELHNAIASTPSAHEPAPTTIGHTPKSTDRTRPRFDDLPIHFGRYGILKLLGRGGMGDVYLAEDALLGRQVALKLPHFDDNVGSEALERFRREAQIAAGFHHPHLCPIYDFGELDGVWFLTMPYITGQPISSLLTERGRLPETEAVPLIARVARAMAVAHEAGVVHRDLKPANILVKEDGQPIVTDFGLARRNEGFDPLLTGAGALVGTPAYMSPEQIGAAPDEVGAACDIYSLGVVLYEILTGRPPFQGTVTQVLRQILIDNPPPISKVVPDVSAPLEAVCSKALAKDPSQRFASMEEFARALEDVGGSSSGSAENSSSAVASTPSLLFSRRTVLLGSALALGLTWGLWSLWPWNDDPLQHAMPDASDQLLPGSRWEGRFRFVGMDYQGSVQVTVEERSGDEFYGIYETENATYVWVIRGTLRGENIRWEFTDVVREKEPRSLVGQAYVEGVCRANQMNVTFRHPGYDSRAEMTLNRVE